MDVDDLFKIARNEAFNGSTEKARVYLKAILERKPNYNDVRTFLGRTYAWDGKRDEARNQLNQVLSQDPKNEEALVALIDVEYWDDNYTKSLELANHGLSFQGKSEDFLYRKARSEAKLKLEKEAAVTLQQLFVVNPSHKDGLGLQGTLKQGRIKNTLTINYARDSYSDVFDPATLVAYQYGRRTPIGSLLFRYNTAQRFDRKGKQFEVEMYPSIVKGVYGYVNYGHSETRLFPQNRLGLELYFKLPKSFEGSAGLRYLYFGGGSQVTLYTATLGKYIGNYWLSLRTFVTPGDAGTSNSYLLLARRYFKDAENYLGIVAGFGFSPDFRNGIQSGEEFSATSADVAVLRSQRLALDYQHTFGLHWLVSAMYNFAKQEYMFGINEYIIIQGPQLTLQYRF